jgi:hypothetical protein
VWQPGTWQSSCTVGWYECSSLAGGPPPVRVTVASDNEALQRSLAFSPIYLTNGIQLSDDPFPQLRAAVYALSVQHRAPAHAATPNH